MPVSQHSVFPHVVGRTSEIFAKGIKDKNPEVTRIIREDKAIEFAASKVNPDDVVVVIVNDDIERSINFIKKYFQADFV